ncbi:DNA primase [Chloroflexia bacterium SDU3-3]|nr:DNA primase [Chloroflexia bacterium SDU3-3]
MNGATDTIKERIDVVEFISGYMSLRKSGKNFVGFCPFHPNTKTPAFYVFPDTQSFHCFGCKASGTVFDFLMRREGLEFRDALEQLAARAGVELAPRTPEEEQEDQQRTRLLAINQAAAVFFQHMLLKSPRGEAARAYVGRRMLDEATVEAFQLGFAPDEWSTLLGYLTDRKGFDPEDVEAAGLVIHRDQGGYFDRFRNRLMFPIRNVKGEIIAFGGRAIGDAQPKYMNSPQTPLFDKGRVLYALDMARDRIRAEDAVVIVEGYVDAIVAHQYGFKNVVAPLGTALTADHVGVLKKLGVKTVYLALDADAAGVRATLKGLQILQENMDGRDVPIPTAQGVVRWGRELDAEIKIIVLPEGRDPDEVIQERPEAWGELVQAARPVMDFYITALTSDLDLASAKGKSDAAARLAPLVEQVTNPVQQAHYIQQIARMLHVEEHTLRAAMPGQPRQPRPAPQRQGQGQQRQGAAPPPQQRQGAAPPPAVDAPSNEDFLLGWLIRHPTARRAVQEKIYNDLQPFPLVAGLLEGTIVELLRRPEIRAIWQAWEPEPESTDPTAWAQQLDADILRPLAMRAITLDVTESQSYRYVNDALERATMLQLNLAREWKKRLSEQLDPADEAAYRVMSDQLMQILSYIDALSIPKRSPTYNDLHTRAV